MCYFYVLPKDYQSLSLSLSSVCGWVGGIAFLIFRSSNICQDKTDRMRGVAAKERRPAFSRYWLISSTHKRERVTQPFSHYTIRCLAWNTRFGGSSVCLRRAHEPGRTHARTAWSMKTGARRRWRWWLLGKEEEEEEKSQAEGAR